MLTALPDPPQHTSVFVLMAGCLTACWIPAPVEQAAPPKPAPVVSLPKGPYATLALRGPFRSREAWCADLAARLQSTSGEPDHALGCATHAPIVTRGPTTLTASSGITLAEIVAFDDGDRLWGPKCALTLRVAAGWFVAENLVYCLAAKDNPSIVGTVAIEELAWHELIVREGESLGAELVVRASVIRATPGSGNVTTTDMFVCGIGATGVPRCTPAIPVHHVGVVSNVKFHPAIDSRGLLRFELEDVNETLLIEEAEANMAAFSRAHSLRFP
jgi:hypothetical protein